MNRSPRFTNHALARAIERFPRLGDLPHGYLTTALSHALLAGCVVYVDTDTVRIGVHGEVSLDARETAVTVRGYLKSKRAQRSPIEFVIDELTGDVMTIVDPHFIRLTSTE